jgi:hypothetical protein
MIEAANDLLRTDEADGNARTQRAESWTATPVIRPHHVTIGD